MSDTLDINVEGTSYPILCGTCNEPIAFIGEAEVDGGKAGCAACGNIDDTQKVAQMAIEYAKDDMQLAFNRTLKRTASKSKIMTFKGQTSHNKAHRFVINTKL